MTDQCSDIFLTKKNSQNVSEISTDLLLEMIVSVPNTGVKIRWNQVMHTISKL